jgi:hypothetical protein
LQGKCSKVVCGRSKDASFDLTFNSIGGGGGGGGGVEIVNHLEDFYLKHRYVNLQIELAGNERFSFKMAQPPFTIC